MMRTMSTVALISLCDISSLSGFLIEMDEFLSRP